jgi:hypothetical protein
MKIADSIKHAIDDWQEHKLESAMLHACNAVDGTAGKQFPEAGSRERFTRFLRENYYILGPMAAPGINLVETAFPIKVKKASGAGGAPDIADVIYAIHRCSHAHGDELPDGFSLIEDAAGSPQSTRISVERGKVRLSDRTIFGLLATAVLAPGNAGQATPALDGYYLTFGKSETLTINDWWGRAPEFPAIAAKEPMPLVKLDFGNWISNPNG